MGLFGIDWNNAPHHKVTPAWVTHQSYVGPKIPDRMVGHTHIVDTIGLVFRAARFGHMAGIDTMSFDLVGIHLHQGHKIFMGHGAVIALQEIVDDGFPVGFQAIAQAVCKGQFSKIRCIGRYFLGEVTALLSQC